MSSSVRNARSFRGLFAFYFQLLWLLSLPPSLLAQNSTSGGLTGVVTDPSNALVPHATLVLRDNEKGVVQSGSTNSVGGYSFAFLAPGNYTLTVSQAGFQTESQTFDISVGPTVTLNVALQIAGARTSVEVTGDEPLIHAENGDASSNMSRLQVEQEPNPGSDLTYVAQTSPGAIMDTDGGWGSFSVLGLPSTSNMFTVNGMAYTNLGEHINESGATNLLLGLNAVEEATIVSNGYSGRTGTLAGAEVNYVTRSGVNEFHGNALYFWNGRVLNANDWFNNALGAPRPFDNANQWAASLGGPIRKDKLFFFVDTEGLDLLIPHTQQIVLPSAQFEAATIANIDAIFGATSASDAFYKKIFALYNSAPEASRATPGNFADPLGCTQFVGPGGLGTGVPCAVHYEKTVGRATYEVLISGRADWNFRQQDRAFLSVAYSHGHQATSTNPISSFFDQNSTQPWWQGQLGETHSFGHSAVNQFLAGAFYLSALFALENPSAALAALPTSLYWGATGTFTPVGSSQNAANGGATTQYQVSDDLTLIRGNHKLGFGASLLGYDNSNVSSPDLGTLVPFSVDAFYQGGVDPATPQSDTTELAQTFYGQLTQRMSLFDLGLYVQDEWHARSNLTLTLALRHEHQSNPVCRSRCFARLAGSFADVSHDPGQPYNQAILTNLRQAYPGLDSGQWAPRFSFAWQPFGVARSTVLRGGIGLFYNMLSGYAATLLYQNPPLVSGYTLVGDNLTPGETTSLYKDAAASNAAFQSGYAAGETLAQLQEQVAGFSTPNITNPDRTLKPPQYQKWNLMLEQALGVNTSVSAGYFGNHLIHETLQNASANAFAYGTSPAGLCASPAVPPCADPRFHGVTELTTAGVSNYNGLVLSLQHRVRGQGVLQANYTFGHAFDETSNGGISSFAYGSSVIPQDPNHFRGSYGPAEYDVRHSFNANYVWEVPLQSLLRHPGSSAIAGALLKGWQVSGTFFVRTGFPYTALDGEQAYLLQANNFFGPIYSVPVAPLPKHATCGKGAATPVAAHPCLPLQTLADGSPNPNALFVQAGCETDFNQGTLPGPSGPCGGAPVTYAQGRNHFRGPGYFDTDFGFVKNTKIPRWDKGELGIGLQFFNFLNHPNFGFPDNYSSDPQFGQIGYTENPPTSIFGAGLGGDASPRNIQVKLQLHF